MKGKDTPMDRAAHEDEVSAHQRIDAMLPRIASLEQWAEGFKLQMTDVANEVKANTRLTEEVHGNTSELIETMADLKVLGRWGKRAAMGAKYLTYLLGFLAAWWAWMNHK